MSATSADLLLTRTEIVDLPDGADPVALGFGRAPGSLSHSTSWRYADGVVLLTFIHVLPDGSSIDADWSGAPAELEAYPVVCHGVRHLHFLRHTDADIRAWPHTEVFWAYAAQVADHHYPAVAGLLSLHDLDRMDFSI